MLAWINTITLGGGYAIVPVIGAALEKRGWMTEEHFYDVFARAQAYPGPVALSTSLLVSIGLCGFRGAAAAFFGVILPPFVAIIFVSSLIGTYGSMPAVKRFLEGAGAVVPGLVAAMVFKTAKRRKWILPRAIEAGALTALLIAFPSLSLPILLVGIFIMYFLEGLWTR